MPRRTEAFRKWFDVELSARAPGERLPTDRQLAIQWNLSERTVRRILGGYGRQGRVVRVPGRGTFTPGLYGAEPVLPAGPAATSSQTIVDEVFRAICAGEIRQGEALPAVKAVCAQFRVSAPTVIRAYRELARRGYVTKVGKTYWVGRFARLVRRAVGRRAYVFRSGSEDFGEVFRNDMLAASYRTMERELSDNGCMVLYAGLAALPRLVDQWEVHREMPHGLAFHGVTPGAFDTVIAPAVRRIRRTAQAAPTVLIDIPAEFSRDFRGFAVLTRGTISTAAARAGARTIVDAGCRRVRVVMEPAASYDPVGGRLWSFWQVMKLRTELTGLSPHVSFRLTVLKDSSGPASVEEFFATLPRLAPAHERSLLAAHRPTTLVEIMAETQVIERLSSMFAGRPDADVWVFAAHARAAEALSLARARGLRVPQDVAIVSLENDPSYYHLGITCCEPDWEQIGYVMAHALLGDIPVERTPRGFLRVAARVVERLTMVRG